ncbi:MAG TPA: iron uptake porin, partial [Allocoleopsis sp.]
MSIKYIVLALSVLVLGFSPDLAQSQEQSPANINHTNESNNILANDLLNSENNNLTNDPDLGQVNNVSEFTDVKPQDWAYEALSNLVSRYNCVSAYPDGTFKGDRALTRYEFADILNSCLQQISKLLDNTTNNFIKKDDLATLRKLKDDFQSELIPIQEKINKLEDKTANLEKSQFSTTALMGGEVIFAGSQAFGGGPPGTGKSNAVFNNLTRLQVVSSFTGKDRLRFELATGNFDGLGFANPAVLNTYTALLSYQAGFGSNIQLSNLEYRFAGLGNRAVFTIKPVGFSLSNVLSPNSPYFDTGRGAISRFGEGNPIFKIGALDAGLGVDYLLNDSARLQLAYGVRNGNDPNFGAFLEKGAHAAGMQLLYLPGND